MEKSKSKRLKFIPKLVLCGVLSGIGTFGAVKVTSAFLSSSEEHPNAVSFANNEMDITETFDKTTETDDGTTVYKKAVSAMNTGNIPVYVRMKILFSDPFAESLSEITNGSGTFAASELASNLPDGWTVGTGKLEGYYYYTKAIAPSESTGNIIDQVKTTFSAADEKYDYEIYVRSDSVQTKRTTGTETKDLTWQEAWDGFIN